MNDKDIAEADSCTHHWHHNKPDVDPRRGMRGRKKLWWWKLEGRRSVYTAIINVVATTTWLSKLM